MGVDIADVVPVLEDARLVGRDAREFDAAHAAFRNSICEVAHAAARASTCP